MAHPRTPQTALAGASTTSVHWPRVGFAFNVFVLTLALLVWAGALPFQTARADWIDITPANLGVAPMRIGFDPIDPDRLFVGSFGDGLFQSQNGGDAWSQNYLDFFEGEGVATILVNDVAFNPANPSQAIAITLSGSYYSADGGVSWLRHPDNNMGDGPAIGFALEAIPDGSGVVASEVGDPVVGGAPWILDWSTNHWTAANPAFLDIAGASTLGIGFDTSDPPVLYIGNTFRNFWTNDLGVTLNNNSAGLSDNNARVVVGDPEISGRVLCGVEGGLFLQTSPGTGWSIYGSDLPAPVWALIHHPLDADLMFAGTDLGVYRSEDRGASWSLMTDPGLLFTKVVDLGIHPLRTDVLYATFSDGTPSGGGVFRLQLDSAASAPTTLLSDGVEILVHPNPGGDRFEIDLATKGATRHIVRTDIYDVYGRRVRSLAGAGPTEGTLGTSSTNPLRLVWDARDEMGRPVAAGAYFVRVETSHGRSVRALRVIR